MSRTAHGSTLWRVPWWIVAGCFGTILAADPAIGPHVDSLARTDAPFQARLARSELPTRDRRIRAVFAMVAALVPALDTVGRARLHESVSREAVRVFSDHLLADLAATRRC